MDAALSYLERSPRTVREVERRLDECEFGEADIDAVTLRLTELGLVNDQAFAQDYIETRLNTKPISKAHLREQLRVHEVPEEIIDEALAFVDDHREQENALAVAQKYNRQFSALPDEERYERVLKRILARGYSFDTAKEAMERVVSLEMEES